MGKLETVVAIQLPTSSLYLQLHYRSCGYPAHITRRSTGGFTSHCARIGPKPSQLESLFGQSNVCFFFS